MVINSFEEVLYVGVFLILFYFLLKCILKEFLAAASECMRYNSCNNKVKTKSKKHKLQRRHRYDDCLGSKKYSSK